MLFFFFSEKLSLAKVGLILFLSRVGEKVSKNLKRIKIAEIEK
ncbi:hypothetical protein RR47_GL000254 [Enterococcus columbae DSM 7374 = ATCC 51263]|nr:hypothetical protein RR47_GL000254 [Enterococcus columbae DSM 7374 = ATCC 51263]